jgi:VWFA-related protein
MRHFLALLLALQLGAQNATFTSNTQLVVETVVVRDKQGQIISGLKLEDFLLTEDGVPQTIKFFEFQQLDNPQPAPLPASVRPELLARLPRAQILSERRDEVKYRDRRLLAMYFDMSAMGPPDQLRALRAAKSFVRDQMTAQDLVALMQFSSGSVQVFQDFTADRQRLLNILETMIVGEDENAPVEANSGDTGAAFGQNDAEFNVFFTDRQLAALQTAAQMLSHLNEKKSLLYFSSGLRLNGVNNQAQLSATINAAVRAGVAFWPIDARGLVAGAPLGDATQASPGGAAVYTGSAANAARASFQRSQDTLFTLAADTGGKALLDSNDLARGIVEAQKSTGSYYVLGYYTSNEKLDGKFRRIEIKLKDGREATLDYRKGYYAQKVWTNLSSADKERQLEDALLLGDPLTELTLALEVSYFQLNRAEYFVPVAVKIPGRELALAKKRGAERTVIDFIGEIKDNFGTTVSNVRDKVDVKLSEAEAAQWNSRPLNYDTAFTLLPGRYKIKMLARDLVTGRIGTFEMPFVVPNLNKELERIPSSSVVLSSQQVPLSEMLYDASKDKGKSLAANPLVSGGAKLVPSVTRVFSKSKSLLVYWELYPGAAPANPAPAPALFAYATLYRDGHKVLDSKPFSLTQATAAKLRTLPLRLDLPLAKIDPGEYRIQLNAIDPATQKASFWQTEILIVP